MTELHRRRLIASLSAGLGLSLGGLHPAIARALDTPARVRTGTIRDVEHVVILMQENRAFDHYFGTLNGVRGFADRFAPPAPDTAARKGRTVLVQPNAHKGEPALIAPFALNTRQTFAHMRVEGTPHAFDDAQNAWDDGRMGEWPRYKHNHAMGYFGRDDLPFQFALAEAFTLCDAYHCSLHAGTNPNRVMHWTGTIDAEGGRNGPVLYNDYDELGADPRRHGGYSWTTYPERLQAAGVSWRVYQDMADNFTDNPLVGFQAYRAADKATSGPLADLATRSIRTRGLDQLKADVLAGDLPQVSWIIGTAEGSEHPGPSSPAQGADYTAQVLDALTADPEVWSRTVLIVNFDENDGFFDHVPPPAPPSRDAAGRLQGATQIDAKGEHHLGGGRLAGRAYGLGPRVPCYVVSPWSRGGYVASETFDHTSVIRFLEARFGVAEPNISAWRRAVCGDLTSCFDFATPNDQPFFAHLPKTRALADQARGLPRRTTPPTPGTITPPVQEAGLRPRRPTPYRLDCGLRRDEGGAALRLANAGVERAAVFHVYDVRRLDQSPKRYTVAAGRDLPVPLQAAPDLDLFILGPDAFHRRICGAPTVETSLEAGRLTLRNAGPDPVELEIRDLSYGRAAESLRLASGESRVVTLDLSSSHGWHDLLLVEPGGSQRLAGRVETGAAAFSDPATAGPAPLAYSPPVLPGQVR